MTREATSKPDNQTTKEQQTEQPEGKSGNPAWRLRRLVSRQPAAAVVNTVVEGVS